MPVAGIARRVPRHARRYLRLRGEKTDELSKTLTDKQTEMLVKYDDAVNEMHSVAEVEAFSFSFRLGVRLMIETEGALTK